MADDKIGILQATEKYAGVTNNAPARIDIDVFRQENTPTMIEIFLNGNAHGTGTLVRLHGGNGRNETPSPHTPHTALIFSNILEEDSSLWGE